MQNIPEIENLIKLISKLPGLGPKSAKRIVLKMINNRDELIKPMAKALQRYPTKELLLKLRLFGLKEF